MPWSRFPGWFGLSALLAAWACPATELFIGAAVADITPAQPVALDGQRRLRVSTKPETPLSASVLALESRDGATVLDQAIMVSCDLVAIRSGVLERVRSKVKPRLPDFDADKLFLSATHTHTAPVTAEGGYTLPEDVMRPAAYVEFLTERVAEAVIQAWRRRQPGKVGWGQSQAVVAHNRRAVYADGRAVMYGSTAAPDFLGLEAREDHDLDVLFFWDRESRLIATAIDVPCPAQEVEGGSSIHADFWHPVRQMLRARHGVDLVVLGWSGAGGDVTSRPMYGRASDERMRRLRGLTRLEEVARRIVSGWEDAYEAARRDMRADVVLRHRVETIELPERRVTQEEAAAAREQAARHAGKPAEIWDYRWHQRVVERFEKQRTSGVDLYPMELHVLRLGDVAIATNDFELYTEFGVRIKARSPALQTFVIQLTGGNGGYLPTERAVRGGGYGAVVQSTRVGPEGGQVLVDRTVKAIESLWAEAPVAASR